MRASAGSHTNRGAGLQPGVAEGDHRGEGVKGSRRVDVGERQAEAVAAGCRGAATSVAAARIVIDATSDEPTARPTVRESSRAMPVAATKTPIPAKGLQERPRFRFRAGDDQVIAGDRAER